MDAGRYPEAAALYRELVQALPENPGLRLDLGLALYSESNYRDAVVQFQAAIHRQPDLEPAWLMLGLSYLKLDEPRSAIEPLERALRISPTDQKARLEIADAYLSVGKVEEASRQFKVITESDPGNPKAWQGLGLSYAALSRVVFGQLEKTSPNSPYHDVLLAQSLLARGQDRSAFYWYKQAIARNGDLPGVHAALAQIYRDSGHPDWASIESNRERQESGPDCTREPLECDYLAGRLSQVLTAANRDDRPENLYWKAQAYERLSAQALAHLAAMPESAEIHELLAEAALMKGDYHGAVNEWRVGLKLAPEDNRVIEGLSHALWLDNQYSEAKQLLEQLVQSNPGSAEIHFELGDTLLATGSTDEAIPQLEEAVKLHPSLAPAQASLGRAYLRAGRPKDAIPPLKAARPGDEKGAALYQLAQAYRQTGQKALADQALREFQRSSAAGLERNTELDKEREITAP